MNHERAGKTHLLGLKADVRAEAALLLPWPARTVDKEANGGAPAMWLGARRPVGARCSFSVQHAQPGFGGPLCAGPPILHAWGAYINMGSAAAGARAPVPALIRAVNRGHGRGLWPV